MPISYVGAGALATSATASVTPAHPAGLATGDVLLAQMYSRAGVTPTPPSGQGWTQIQLGTSTGRLSVWWRVFTAGNVSGAWTGGGTSGFYGVISAYRGVDATTPLDATTPAAATGTSTTATAPSITTSTDDAYAVSCFANADNGGGTGFAGPTNGFTLSYGGNGYTTTVGSDGAIAATRKALGAAGATGSNSLTVDDDFGFGTVSWVAITVALRPLATGQNAAPAGVGSGEQVGAVTITRGPTPVSPAGVATAEAAGAPTVLRGPVAVAPAGVAGADLVGEPRIALSVHPGGVAGAEQVGVPTVEIGKVVAPHGVLSAEQVGAPTLGRGPVTVALPGVPGADQVGTPAVRLQIRPAGAPAQAVVGTPTVLRGPVSVVLAGAGDASQVGAPTVLRGPVAVVLTGVTGAEQVGVPRIRLALLLAGVPTAEVVGAPTLLRGGIAVHPAGIPSGEVVGSPSIRITLSLAAAPGIRPRLHVLYELLCMARVPQAVGPPTLFVVDAIEWRTLAYGDTLSLPQSLEARCPVASLTGPVLQRLATPDRTAIELHLLRDGQTVMAGPLRSGRLADGDLVLTAAGLLSYTQEMWVRSDLASGTWPAGGRFVGVDQFAIAAALIDQWQTADPATGWTHAHRGIDTSQIGTSGRLRDREYGRDEQHKVSQRIEELGAVLDGFDTEVDPVTRQLQMHYPWRGLDRSTGPDAIVFDEHMVTTPEAAFALGPDDLASVAFGSATSSGADTVLWSQQVNEELRAQYGAAGVAASYSGISEQSTLDERTAAALAARDRTLWVPGAGMRVTPDVALDSYSVGDTVQVHLGGGLGIQGAWRIRRRQVRVSEEGVESVDLEFV